MLNFTPPGDLHLPLLRLTNTRLLRRRLTKISLLQYDLNMKSFLSTSFAIFALTAGTLATPVLKTRQPGVVIRSCTVVRSFLALMHC